MVIQKPLRRIYNDNQLSEAKDTIDQLYKKGELTEEERDYLYILNGLVIDYIKPNPVRLLQGLMDKRGLTQNALARETGISQSVISELLSGKRQMNIGHIKRLSRYFNLRPADLIE